MKKELDLENIKKLLPHREPMLLIEKISNIVPLKSATGHINVLENSFFFGGHFPGQPVFPGVLIVEAFGQTAAALSAHCMNPSEFENKLVFLMTIDKARFRIPVMPPCELLLNVKVEKIKGKIWKYSGQASVGNRIVSDAQWMATIADRENEK